MSKLGPVSVGESYPVRIVGILNVSPESFYKTSIATNKALIEKKVTEMEQDGADIIDVGGMSTAPYLKTLVSSKIESERIIHAIKIIQKISNVPISVDTCRAEVAKIALDLGAEIINDVSGLNFDKDMVKTLYKYNPSVILCAFSKDLVVGNQIYQTRKLLQDSLKIARTGGISSEKIVVDPAIGFFRRSAVGQMFTRINSDWVKRDLLILNNLSNIHKKFPILVSVSLKSFIGKLLRIDSPSDRLYGSLAAESIAILNGAHIIRTHNVRESKQVAISAKNFSQKFKKGL